MKMAKFSGRQILLVLTVCTVISAANIGIAVAATTGPQVQNIGRTVSVDTRSGSAAAGFALSLPAGRGGIGPSLALGYSTAAGNGPQGWGWSLDLGGAVVRSQKKGIPKYDATDTFIAQLGGKSFDLVAIGGGVYRSLVEEDHIRFTLSANQWIAQDRTGMKYYFGSRSGSTVSDGPTRAFKWRLDRIQDVNGNVMVIDHAADGAGFNIRYSLKVGKNPNSTTDLADANNFAYHVVGIAEASDRPDVFTDYKAGFAITEKRRLSSVMVYGGGNLLRKYTLQYRSASASKKSLLASITQYGMDGSTTGEVITFTYNDAAPIYTKAVNGDPLAGDNLWNSRFSGGYDRGHENYGPVPGFDVDLGPTYSQPSGNWGGGSWNVSTRGRLKFSSGQDSANMFWTNLYVTKAKTINVPFITGGVVGVYLNGDYSRNVGTTWALKAGYNLVVITAYHQHEGFSFDLNTDLSVLVDIMSATQVTAPQMSADFNGDGITDVATFYPDTGTFKVAQSTRGGSFLPKATWIDGFAKGNALVLGDFNGGGRVDIGYIDTAAAAFRVASSDGTKFTNAGVWLSAVPAKHSVLTGDFNADGKTDLLFYNAETNGTFTARIAQSSGTGFIWQTAFVPKLGSTNTTLVSADMNGDGLADLLTFNKTKGSWSVQPNVNGFGTSAGVYSVSGFGVGQEMALLDINNDGRLDIAYYNIDDQSLVYRLSREGGFGKMSVFAPGFTLTDPLSRIQTGDFNGDGASDFIGFSPDGVVNMILSPGTAQDLLISYSNALGGKVSLDYAPSTAYSNRYLPFTVPVVNSVVVTNGLGESVRTNYAYSGGYWDALTREYYGFAEAKVFDVDGNYSVTQFHQENIYLRGKVKRSATYNATNDLLQETRNQWNVVPVIAGRADIQSAYLKRTDSWVYDASFNPPRTGFRKALETSGFNAEMGVPTEIKDLGEVIWATGADSGSDAFRIVMTYASNASLGIYGLPATSVTFNSSGAVVSKDWIYYDGSVVSGAVTKGLATKKTVWNKTGTVESAVSSHFTYNAYGLVLTTKDALNALTSVTYDPVYAMFPLLTTDAKNLTRSSDYYGINGVAQEGNPWGAGRSSVDANGNRSTSVYDVLGRVVKQYGSLDTASLPTVKYEYQQRVNHHLIVTRRLIEHGTAGTLDSYTFIDALGRAIVTKTPSATAGQYVVSGHQSYNARGLVDKAYPPYFSTQPAGVLELANRSRTGTVAEYDALGRKVKEAYPDGTLSTYGYSHIASAVVDPNGHLTVAVHDARGRVIRMEEWGGACARSTLYPYAPWSMISTASYEYDVKGNLIKVYDATGVATTMTYDALSRKIAMTSPDMHGVNYTYDAVGQLSRQVDAKNIPFAFTYDSLGRPLTKGRTGTVTENVSYTYDTGVNGKGRLGQATYPNGRATFTYNAIGEETSSTKTIDGVTYSVGRTYDALGRIKTIAYPDGVSKVSYKYNLAGQLNSVMLTNPTSTKTIITSQQYNERGQITRIDYGNGVVALYTYDSFSFRLKTQRVSKKTGTLLQGYDYTYDPKGNIIRVDDKVRSTTKTYKYDERDRMILSNDGTGAIAYAYDKAGNLIKKGNLTYTYAQNGAGQHAVTSITDGTKMSYDANGNMVTLATSIKTQYFTYDGSNRLIKVEAKDAGATTVKYSVAEYGYDGDGGRTKKTVYVKNGTAKTTNVTRFVGELFEETAGYKTDFVFSAGARVAAWDGSKLRWFIGDHLGSTSTVLDETGTIKERIDYTPWGEVKSYEKYGSTSEVAWFYFTGKKLDDETGLVYFGARYYSPKIGRFITADTIVQDPYNPQTLNRYTYCNNNPINLVDPTGHSWKWGNIFRAAVIAVVGIALTVVTGGAFAAALGTFWGGVASGALMGATIGGATSAAMGGNIGQGMLIGGVGGAVFAGLSPGLSSFSSNLARSATLGGAAGPMGFGTTVASNFTGNFLAGAGSGAAVGSMTGADVGRSALIGGAIAGGFSLLSDTAYSLRTKEIEQCKLDPSGKNLSGISSGARGDNVKLAGARYNPFNSKAGPAPLGGHQGGQGKIFGFNYPPGGIIDHVFESWAGPHDWLNGWTYDSVGNLRSLNILERGINTFTNPLNVGIAAPLAIPLALPQQAAAPGIIYGIRQE